MVENENKHALIDGYLKKSWTSRLWSILAKLFFLCLSLLFIAYVFWRIAPPSRQEDWRRRFPVVEQTVSYLEEKGVFPATQPVSIAEKKESKAASQRPGKTQRNLKSNQPKAALAEAKETREGEVPSSFEEEALKNQISPKIAERTQQLAAKMKADRDSGSRVLRETKLEHAAVTIKDQNGNIIKEYKTREEYESFVKQREEKTKAEKQAREKATMAYLTKGGLSVSWKPWEKNNPVTWEDFRDQNIDEEISRWGAYISSTFAVGYNGRTWMVFAYMIPESSWVRPGQQIDEILRHERLHFDISELFARKLRALIPKTHPTDVVEVVDAIRTEASQLQVTYDAEAHGNQENQLAWEKNVAESLEQTSNFKWTPQPRSLAKKQYPQGYFLLGQTYDHGDKGFERSEKLARKWYNIAIQKKNTDALNNMAVLHQKGIDGKPPNHKKALKFYLRAAKRKNSYAMFNAGVMYWRGLGVEANREKAMHWFTESADSVPYSRKALKMLESGPN